jgi:hypothetical protein
VKALNLKAFIMWDDYANMKSENVSHVWCPVATLLFFVEDRIVRFKKLYHFQISANGKKIEGFWRKKDISLF